MQTTPFTVNDTLARAYLPPRTPDGNKGTFGTALLFCGNAYTGAALLACEGALRSGCGLTVLCAPKAVCASAVARTPEVVCLPQESYLPASAATQLQKATAVLVGCGSGVSVSLFEFVRNLILSNGAPAVLDADALNTLSKDMNLCKYLFANQKRCLILTPHPLEFSRLTGVDVPTIQADRCNIAAAFAKMWGVVLLLKGAQTVIASPSGEVAVLPFSCSALAKGGSGDVLAGVITSILAQGATPFQSACLGAYLHGKAGQSLSKLYSPYGVTPSDLPVQIAKEISTL